jgi:DNA gyrase subunit A
MKTKNGPIVGTLIVSEADQVFVVTDSGRVIRSRIADVRATARNTQGVRFMRLDDDERIVAITRVPEEGDEEGTEPPPEAEAGGEG